MRVFNVITAIQTGGAEIVASQICKYIAADKENDIYLVSVRKNSNTTGEFDKQFRTQLKAHNVKLIEINSIFFPFLFFFNALYFVLRYKIGKNDIIHLHTDIPDLFGFFLIFFTRARFIRTLHNTVYWQGRKWLAYIVERTLASSVRVAVSKEALSSHNELLKKLKLKCKKTGLVIHNGIDVGTCESSKDLVKLNYNKFNFAFIGRLTEQKGIDILIDAIFSLSESHKNKIHFHIIGDGNLLSYYRLFAKENNLPITFYGSIYNASSLIVNFDCIIMPSRYEGIGLVAIEALSRGKKVIAYRAPGLKEIFDLISEPTLKELSSHYLKEEIISCIENPNLLAIHSDTISIIKKYFSLDEMLESYKKTYKNILE